VACNPGKKTAQQTFGSNLNRMRGRSETNGKDEAAYSLPMIDAISSAAYGLKTSANQFEKAAQKVVKASAPETGAADDLPAAIVDTQTSALSFKANAAVFKTADRMMGTLLDTLA
jgi:hypothetical protein